MYAIFALPITHVSVSVRAFALFPFLSLSFSLSLFLSRLFLLSLFLFPYLSRIDCSFGVVMLGFDSFCSVIFLPHSSSLWELTGTCEWYGNRWGEVNAR